jgi:hypothetical protein
MLSVLRDTTTTQLREVKKLCITDGEAASQRFIPDTWITVYTGDLFAASADQSMAIEHRVHGADSRGLRLTDRHVRFKVRA